MISTSVLVTVVLASYVLLAGAFYALVSRIGGEVTAIGVKVDKLVGEVHDVNLVAARIDERVAQLEQRS